MSLNPAAHGQPIFKIVLAFAAIYIIWGSTYLAIAFAIESLPPLWMAGMRFFTSGLVLFIYSHFYIKEKLTKEILIYGLITGFLMFILGHGAVVLAEKHLPSGLVSIISSTVPFWLLIMDKKSGSARFQNGMNWLGLVLGFTGIVLLFVDRLNMSTFSSASIFSFGILTIGAMGWSMGTLYAKYHPMKVATIYKVAVQMVLAGLMFFILSLFKGELNHFDLSQGSKLSWLSLIYLTFVGSLIGYFAYMWLLEHISASLVGTYAYVNPIVAVGLGYFIAGETVSSRQIIALIIILGGLVTLYLSQSKFYKSKKLKTYQ